MRTFGDADIANRRALTTQDHFRIGSNTKTFVISVLLQLVDEGKLSLDDPLSKFSLGVTVPDAAHISVRELCQMRSGLSEASDSPEFNHMKLTSGMVFEPRTVIRWAVRQKPYFPPGTGYHYSNTNYLLLGLIIESVTGHSVAYEMRTRLLAPFSLAQTSYPDSQVMPEPWAHGYALHKRAARSNTFEPLLVRYQTVSRRAMHVIVQGWTEMRRIAAAPRDISRLTS